MSELCKQVAGLFEIAERRRSTAPVPAPASCRTRSVHMLARPGKERFHRSAPSCVRSEVQQPRYGTCTRYRGGRGRHGGKAAEERALNPLGLEPRVTVLPSPTMACPTTASPTTASPTTAAPTAPTTAAPTTAAPEVPVFDSSRALSCCQPLTTALPPRAAALRSRRPP